MTYRPLAVPLPPPDAPTLPAPPPFTPRFERCEGVEVLRLDLAALLPAELPTALEAAGRLIRSQPPASLRVLTRLGAGFDTAAAEALKRCAELNTPFVRASAVIAPGFWSVVVVSIKLHLRRELRLFTDEAAALAWLAGR